MSPLPTTAVAVLAALALAVAACGGKSDDENVKEVATQLANADAKVCDKATANFLKAIGGSRAECRKSAKQDDGSTKPKVGEIKVDGDKATAVLKSGKSKATLGLVKDGDQWKLDSVR